MFPAIFEKDENGLFIVTFPDLPGCFTEAPTPEEAIEMAWDASSMWLTVNEDEGNEIPVPSKLEDHKAVNGFVNYVISDTEMYRFFIENKSVKKTLTIPNWLNKLAEKANINFSQVLQDALRNILQV